MIALLSIGILHQAASPYWISHHVTLREPVLQANDFRRDGSMVGSCGEMGLHDGQEFPLIVIHGKQIRLANKSQLASKSVAAILPGGFFDVLSDGQHPQKAKLSGSKLTLQGPISPHQQAIGKRPTTTSSNAAIDKLFPIPEGMRDTAMNERLYWYDCRGGSRLAQVDISWHMEYGHRVAFRDSKGHLRALEDCIPALAGYQVRGIEFVSNDGWFVVDAIRKQKSDPDSITLGFGNELFWIEPNRT